MVIEFLKVFDKHLTNPPVRLIQRLGHDLYDKMLLVKSSFHHIPIFKLNIT